MRRPTLERLHAELLDVYCRPSISSVYATVAPATVSPSVPLCPSVAQLLVARLQSTSLTGRIPSTLEPREQFGA